MCTVNMSVEKKEAATSTLTALGSRDNAQFPPHAMELDRCRSHLRNVTYRVTLKYNVLTGALIKCHVLYIRHSSEM